VYLILFHTWNHLFRCTGATAKGSTVHVGGDASWCDPLCQQLDIWEKISTAAPPFLKTSRLAPEKFCGSQAVRQGLPKALKLLD